MYKLIICLQERLVGLTDTMKCAKIEAIYTVCLSGGNQIFNSNSNKNDYYVFRKKKMTRRVI
jgi:hypothetical protein